MLQTPATGSWDIVETRKCHADTDTDANRIRTKNIMSPSPSVGDIIIPNPPKNKIRMFDPPKHNKSE